MNTLNGEVDLSEFFNVSVLFLDFFTGKEKKDILVKTSKEVIICTDFLRIYHFPISYYLYQEGLFFKVGELLSCPEVFIFDKFGKRVTLKIVAKKRIRYGEPHHTDIWHEGNFIISKHERITN